MATLQQTFEKVGVDYTDVFHSLPWKDEEIITHPTSLKNNTFEARVILKLEMPDGSEWECNKVIKLKLEQTKEASQGS